ncbi:glycosyltransferase [Erysipelothrix sp. HDW6C]|uniref:glycosyltransferase n=1 Tax=Erysipelothrix sp. HDW6C TaxID=2714930 RepID=UPI001407BFAA|nr:RecX family transcriptional regulator [Erysipelothrix sp. HDW6C]QIK69963.1 glycosyltransferase [Erysipelothrix sp. HDW6C]
MRIGLFTDTYTPDINGVVTSIVTLQVALERQGHTVFIITNQPSILNTSYENNVLRLPGIELKFLYGYVLSSPLHIQALSVIKEMGLDVIHVHSEFGVGMFARIVAKNLHLPLVSTYHTTYEDYTHYVNLLGLKSVDHISRIAVAKMSRMFTKTAQVIIAPSEKTKKMLLGYDIKKEIAVIPTGLDLQRFANRDEAALAAIKDRFNLHDTPLFVYIGRLAKEKSIDVVIRGFKELMNRNINAKLLIVGGGPSADELKDLTKDLNIAERVVFVGPVDSSEVVRYYQVADAFISASLTETQGLTYIEALACGLCVFARPDRPLDGIIVDDETGYLFETSEVFADKASAFVNADADKRSKLRENALAKAATFDSSVFADSMLEVYRRAVDMYFGKSEVVEIHERGDGQIELILDSKGNRDSLVVDEFILERRKVEVGEELSRVELNEMEDDQQVYQGYQLALQRIGVRDYTSFEMGQFLHEKLDLSQEQIDIVVDLLKKRRFIDDDRYFRDKLDYHHDQMRGNHRIIEDLEKRGFSSERIQEALEDDDYESYIERGLKRSESYLRTLRDGSQRQREDKLSQHLLRQGYEYSVIKDIIARLDSSYGEDEELSSLRTLIDKTWARYEKRSADTREITNRVVKHALSKGYDYDMIAKVLEDRNSED